ncbi:GNAT family N-acetyltransferase [Paraburkholderia sp. UCT31]|uniref:GNAT family N-acetyltransferase n=1 Tax=Paraburkholderia sp. UCT31 TaxID=2615209 RepID=UPI001656287B|nr:GNAT family N-acetyltransferase [Paraburkholderia sp. UCT31]MBC8742612.1 GNAT family N-acetyltransferase [Paraburkholderia sp. UCT31]
MDTPDDRPIFSVGPGSVFEESQLLAIDHPAQAGTRHAKMIREALRDGTCWIAAQDDALLGYAIRGAFFDYHFLQLVYVAVAHRRQGIGDALVEALERACHGDRLFASASGTNAAMRGLLARRGYRASGEVYNVGPDGPELIFMKPLGASAGLAGPPA